MSTFLKKKYLCSCVSFTINVVLKILINATFWFLNCIFFITGNYFFITFTTGKNETSYNALDLKSYIYLAMFLPFLSLYMKIQVSSVNLQTLHPLWDKLKTAQVL